MRKPHKPKSRRNSKQLDQETSKSHETLINFNDFDPNIYNNDGDDDSLFNDELFEENTLTFNNSKDSKNLNIEKPNNLKSKDDQLLKEHTQSNLNSGVYSNHNVNLND
jgi:hypothetical protein